MFVLLPLNAGLDHITRHKFQPLVEMEAELRVRPVQVSDEGLESVQLPEQIFRGGAARAEWKNVETNRDFATV